MAADDLKFAGNDSPYCLWIRKVFLLKNSRRQSRLILSGQNGNNPLQDNYSMVQVFVDEVHSAAGILNSVVESLLLRVEARECW